MKVKLILTCFICALLPACTIPCDIFFRNLSSGAVLLRGKLVDRWRFDKLPHKVNFYDTAQSSGKIYGEWKYQKLITWTDSVNFEVTIPAYSVIDLSDVSRGLTLGAKSPDVLLTISSDTKTDTLTTGDYLSLAAKFHVKRSFISTPVYYYDQQ